MLVGAVAFPTAPAGAAGPTAITITGPGLSAPLTVKAANQPELFSALWRQVNWMSDRPGQTKAPKASKQGPKYTVVVMVKNAPRQTYDLYPLAEGGPRAFRPAKQPDLHATTSAWFFGRLNMSEALRGAGVPLPARPDALSAGIGGGKGESSAFDPVEDMSVMLGEWRQVYLLNAAVIVAIALGLAGFSLLVRRKV